MADRTFASLNSVIAASAPGCPNPTMEQYIRRIAIEVCEKTLTWRYEQPVILLTQGMHNYDFDTPTNTEVAGVLHATINNVPIKRDTLDAISNRYPAWPVDDPEYYGWPAVIGQLDADHFAVAPTPDALNSYNIRMILALRPTPDATGMNQTVLDDCEDVIVHGVLQQLLVLPNKSWTDRELASYHAKQYVYKTSLKRAKTNLGAPGGSLTVQMRPLA